MKRNILLAAILLLFSSGCHDGDAKNAAMVTGGDPDRGRDELRQKGCGACHTIPGVPGATALVGPPLDHMATRGYLAGSLPNSPANMTKWIQHPQEVKPHNAMPDIGITEADAKDMTAYLYMLR